jgi:hypothetical protein
MSSPLSAVSQPSKSRARMSTRNRVLFFVTGWLIVLMPFLFWWNTWFGRQLSDKQITEYLRDDQHPRHIQHALVQIGERMSRKDPTVTRWYPQLTRLADYKIEEVRNTDAWVMGQDTAGPGFHDALVKMLSDPSLTVRGNAALSLVRFGDAVGKPEILELLQPAKIVAPEGGTIVDAGVIGIAVHQGGMIAKLHSAERTVEIRSPITGRLREFRAQIGQKVAAGDLVATIDPAGDQVWEALRALYFIGQPQDIAAVQPYERELPDISNDVRQQAVETDQAIRERAR